MGIADKIGHAAEELKEKGQEAMHKVTGKSDGGHEGSAEQPMDYPRDTGGHAPATGGSGQSPQTWDADSTPGSGSTGSTAGGGSTGSNGSAKADHEWRPAVGGDATPDHDVERRDPNTDPMRIPPPTKANNQDNVGKVNYLQ